MRRFHALALSVVTAAVTCCGVAAGVAPANAAAADNSVTVAVLSDTQPSDAELPADVAVGKAVESLAAAMNADAWIYAGDSTENGTATEWNAWNQIYPAADKALFRPVSGNHDYLGDNDQSTSAAWWSYWGAQGGNQAANTRYYSWDLASWHFIMLDASGVGADITTGSAQYGWLSADLAAHQTMPTIVVVHWGRFSAANGHLSNTALTDAWNLLLANPQVELMLAGHQHVYERWDRLNATGEVDPAGGIRIITVPAAGQPHPGAGDSGSPLPAVWYDGKYPGVLKLTLTPTSYSWQLQVPAVYAAGLGTPDSGTQTIRQAAPVTAATTTSLAVTPATVAYGAEQAARASVTVASQSSTPVGTVTVRSGTTALCTVTLVSGTGSCPLPATALPVGTAQLTAAYNGSAGFAPSTSAAKALTVARAASKTTLSLSVSKVTYGAEKAERMTVTVAPQYAGAPAGTVTVKAGTRTVCTIKLASGTGSCHLTAAQLPVGIQHLTATYNGSAGYARSTSAAKTLTVVKAARTR